MSNVAIVGPVFPYRAGIAYCTTELAKQLDADVFSFSRQYPRFLYPGGDDRDETLPPVDADFSIDVMNPWTWIRAGWKLRKYDSVVFVWWIWVWALPYRVMMALLRRRTQVLLQCHNIGDKEPAWWKRKLTNIVLRRGRILVTHAMPEASEAWKRSGGRRIVRTFLPVHELGGVIPSREKARRDLDIDVDGKFALFFGHIRPFKGLDIALKAWRDIETEATLLVAGEAWWKAEDEYRKIAPGNVLFDFRFIPDAEIATWFAAADVVLAPYRIEAQSGVALTAFHFSRPVIATTVGGLPEIIEEGRNGMLIPPEDPAALGKAIDRFFARNDREAMERHAAASARKYSWEEYAALFRRLLSGG
ncbi:MAG: glycosyltransferase family 4 protein [Acidobacteria bacterium]|nr:glycosyltransferase family 4 protein [Acidobacteriota bacterium]